jgi:hypothetical protein
VLSENRSLGAAGILLLIGPLAFCAICFRPQIIVRALMVVLGAAPFASVPVLGFQIQIVVCLALTYWLATAVGLVRSTSTSGAYKPAIYSVCGLLFLSLLSFVATRGQFGSADDMEFVKWASAISLVLIFARQSASEVRRLGRIFVVAVASAAAFALATVFLPGGSALLDTLGIIGYQRNVEDSQAYFLQNGERVATRLAGTFVDPNIAAMFFFVAAILAVILFAGRIRFLTVGVLLLALAATLSRGGMLALAIALVVFIVFNRRNLGRRAGVLLAGVGLAALVLAVPVTRQRLLTSFGQEDIGAVDRLEALDQFSSVMAQDWVWGLGWGRPEFRNAAVSYAVNMVANAPLGTIYRAGIVAGAGFVLVLLVSAWVALKMIRQGTWRGVAAGGMVFGFVAAIQTGYGVVTITPMTGLMSVVLFLVVRREAFLDAERTIVSSPEAIPAPVAIGWKSDRDRGAIRVGGGSNPSA